MKPTHRSLDLIAFFVLAWIAAWPGTVHAQQSTPGPESSPAQASPTPVATLAPDPAQQRATPPSPRPSPARAASPQAPTRDLEDEANGSDRRTPISYSTEAVGLAALLIAVLGLLFFLQLKYAHVLEQTSYLGDVFRESVFNFEFKRLSAPIREEWSNGEYHRAVLKENPPPPLDDRLRELDERWGDGRLAQQRQTDLVGLEDPWIAGRTRRPGGTTLPPGIAFEAAPKDEADQGALDEYRKLRKAYLQERDDWHRKINEVATKKYQADLGEKEAEAKRKAETAVGSTDVAVLRGRGPQFVLEFTALIVIIFSAVVLGILGRLGPQQIGTLLAAIAGYVLGRATTSRASGGDSQAGGKV